MLEFRDRLRKTRRGGGGGGIEGGGNPVHRRPKKGGKELRVENGYPVKNNEDVAIATGYE